MPRLRFILALVFVGVVALPAAAASAPSAVPGSQRWATRTVTPFDDKPNGLAISPDGTRAFVVGFLSTAATATDFAAVALDEATGAQLWLATYVGPTGNATANTVAVSPDGSRVYVTGRSSTSATGDDYTTIAYDAGTGTQLWLSRYNGRGNGDDTALAIAANPDGTKVYVTGQSDNGAAGIGYGTVAYDAATGAQLWSRTYDKPGSSLDIGQRVLASPGGTLVFVSGTTSGTSSAMTTIAYDATTGSPQWIQSEQADRGTTAASIAETPSGGLLFAVGTATRSNNTTDLDVVAYVAATGSVVWSGAFGPGQRAASGVAVNPDGNQVYVSGWQTTSNTFLVRSYQAGTGSIQWTGMFHGPGAGGSTTAIGVSADGSKVYVTGQNTRVSTDYLTVSFSSTGTKQWGSWYDGPGQGTDWPTALAVSPANGDVIVTGYSAGLVGGTDFATIAYQG